MTTGSWVNDRRVNYQVGYRNHFHQFVPTGNVLVGLYESKSWSGTDRPKVAPVYESYDWFHPYERRWIRRRRRVSAVTRRDEEDHPYSCLIVFQRSSGFQRDVYLNGTLAGYAREAVTDTTYGVTPSSEWNANDDLALIGKLREAVAGSDFNAGVSLGEAGQTLDLIFGAATRIRTALGRVRRGDVHGAARALGQVRFRGRVSGNVASNWLELQYGWLPLLKDVQGAAEFLGKHLNFPYEQSYKVRKRQVRNVNLQPPGYTRSNVVLQGSTKGQIIARVTEVNIPQLIGLTDPASVAWELVPYSFVADWFIPIGAYLSARGLAQSLTATYVTTKTTRLRAEWRYVATTDAQGYLHTFTPDAFVSERRTQVNRTVSSTLQVPQPQVKPLGEVASWKRAANAIALLVGRRW